MRLGLNTEQLHLRKLAAVAPLAIGSAYCFGPGYLARLAVMAASAAALKLALARLSAARTDWGHTLFEAVLLSLLAPAALPWYLGWVCPALALLLRWMLGGRDGVVPLNVPAVVLAVLLVHFGGGAMAIGRWAAPAWFGPAASQYFLCGALPAGLSALAAVILLARVYKYALLAAFIAPVVFLSGLLVYTTGGWGPAVTEQLIIFNGLLVAAVFLAADEASSPRAGWAQALQGLASAAVFLLFARKGQLFQAVVWSAFIPSLATPWLDAAAAYRRPMPLFPAGTGIQE